MKLTHLSWRRYRNLVDASLEPHPQLNLFVGGNGQGKTNLLSALYWLATLRPLQTQRLRELPRWGERETQVKGHVERDELIHCLEVSLEGGKRVSRRENKQVSARDYFGVLSVVTFTPRDLSLVYGTPEDRRRFLDRAIFTGQSAHLQIFIEYQRALSSRNRLLRERAPSPLLEAYEPVLAARGATLALNRARYCAALGEHFSEIYKSISGRSARLTYRAGFSWPEALEGAALHNGESVTQVAARLQETWAQQRESDRERGFTTRGPQQDELTIRLDDRPARAYASQGQQRALALCLKLAEVKLLETRQSLSPLLLLDDISSELDQQKTEALFHFLEQFQGQSFLTTTDERYIPLTRERQCWYVEAGTLKGGAPNGEISN